MTEQQRYLLKRLDVATRNRESAIPGPYAKKPDHVRRLEKRISILQKSVDKWESKARKVNNTARDEVRRRVTKIRELIYFADSGDALKALKAFESGRA